MGGLSLFQKNLLYERYRRFVGITDVLPHFQERMEQWYRMMNVHTGLPPLRRVDSSKENQKTKQKAENPIENLQKFWINEIYVDQS